MKDDKGGSGKERFEELLRLLDSDRERAGEKYQALRRKLVKFFQCNLCFPAEDLADETLWRLALKIETIDISDVVRFAFGIAKNVQLEAGKKADKTVPLSSLGHSEDLLPDTLDVEKDLDERMQLERGLRCLDRCLQRLPEQDRRLLVDYYHEGTSQQLEWRQGLANQSGLTLGALRVKINRWRDGVEQCARKCLASGQSHGRRGR